MRKVKLGMYTDKGGRLLEKTKGKSKNQLVELTRRE